VARGKRDLPAAVSGEETAAYPIILQTGRAVPPQVPELLPESAISKVKGALRAAASGVAISVLKAAAAKAMIRGLLLPHQGPDFLIAVVRLLLLHPAGAAEQAAEEAAAQALQVADPAVEGDVDYFFLIRDDDYNQPYQKKVYFFPFISAGFTSGIAEGTGLLRNGHQARSANHFRIAQGHWYGRQHDGNGC